MMPRPRRSFSMHPRGAVGATSSRVDLGDEIGEPGMTYRPGRRTAHEVGVVPGPGDLEHPRGERNCMAFAGDHADRLEAPFGGTALRSNSLARRVTASSASSSAIRRRAAISSALSELLTPGRSPASISHLAAPVVDRLAAHPELASDLGDAPAGLHQLQDAVSKFGWVSPWHVAPLQGSSASKIPETGVNETGARPSSTKAGQDQHPAPERLSRRRGRFRRAPDGAPELRKPPNRAVF
jgi:hypothetical protein